MENNIQQIEVPGSLYELDAMEASMQNELGRSLGSSNFKCSIYKVPDFIRRGNEEYYRPSVISIGPVFYKDPQLQTMQQLRWICLDSFLKRPENAGRSLKHYINIVSEIKGEIQERYEEPSMISCSSDDEFVEMIVLDAVFLLCLFTGIASGVRAPRKLKALHGFIKRDTFMLENQIPFFVIKCIFDEAFPEPRSSLIELTHRYIRSCAIPGCKDEPIEGMSLSSNDIAHLLDFWWKSCRLSFDTERREQAKQGVVTATGNEAGKFVHLLDVWSKCCSLSFHTQQREEKTLQLPRTAKQLSAAGVTFKKIENESQLWITFYNSTGEFHLPKFTVDDLTEYGMRNILFFEQCHYYLDGLTYFIDWVTFLNALIDNVQDIQILEQAGVLQNEIGSDEALLDLFKKIDKNVCYSTASFNYSNVCQEVNRYANKPWNRWKAILRRDYFNHPWAIISFIFAVILFILTVIQTITSFKKN